MELAKVENGTVIFLTDRENTRRRTFRPSDGAVFADFGPATEKIVVVTSKGFVELWSKLGNFERRIYSSSPAAQMARWVGDEIMVQFSNGKTSMFRGSDGCWLRNIY